MILRKTSLVALASLALPLVALAATPTPSTKYFGDLGTELIKLVNNVFVPVLFAVAFIVFLFGVAKTYIFSHGDPAEIAKGHKLILWGLIGFFVMLSLWGLVNLLTDTVGLTNDVPGATGGTGLPKGPTTTK